MFEFSAFPGYVPQAFITELLWHNNHHLASIKLVPSLRKVVVKNQEKIYYGVNKVAIITATLGV